MATLLGPSRSGVALRYADAIDRLAEIFLATGLLRESRPDRRVRYFAIKDDPAALPPKKPVSSVSAEEYHIVRQATASGQWSGRGCDA